MNTEDWLIKIARAIENRSLAGARSWHIGFFCGGIVCWPRRYVKVPDQILGTYTERQLERGLTKKQWDDLKYNIAKYLEGQKDGNKRKL